MAATRIAPVEPPYEPEVEEILKRWTPGGYDVDPPAIFRLYQRHPELASRLRPLGGYVLGHALIGDRARELVILRTTARAGAEYEWGVHAATLARDAGLTAEQIAATAKGTAGDPAFDERDSLIIALCDELHDTATVSDGLWSTLAEHWDDRELLELVVIVGWYRLHSYVLNAARLELEPWGERFPK
ncbi:MAG TPA: carboxymuconolactone decarboxylase family protein [Thermoleophilaceae bacterium]